MVRHGMRRKDTHDGSVASMAKELGFRGRVKTAR